jgi:hypothetical protein
MWWRRLFRRRRGASNAAFRQALGRAAEGRRAAIYERGTGLYAYWYLQLRVEEEIVRAERGGGQLACISLHIEGDGRIDALAPGVRDALRLYDMAAGFDDGHVVIVLLDTGDVGVQVVLGRVALALGDVIAGVARYPDDGRTFEELLEAARSGAERIVAAAAA